MGEGVELGRLFPSSDLKVSIPKRLFLKEFPASGGAAQVEGGEAE